MKRFVLRRFFHAALLMLALPILVLSAIFFFPEFSISTVFPFVAPGYSLDIGSLVWNRRGVTLYDLAVSHQAGSARVVRSVLVFNGFTNGVPSLSLTCLDGNVVWDVPSFRSAPRSAGTPPSLWWQRLQAPAELQLAVSNISVHLTAPWLPAPLAATFSLAGLAGSSGCHNRIALSCSLSQPVQGEWSLSASQHATAFDLLLDLRNLTVDHLLNEYASLLPIPVSVSQGLLHAHLRTTFHISDAGLMVTSLYASSSLADIEALGNAGSVSIGSLNLSGRLKPHAAWLPYNPDPDSLAEQFALFTAAGHVEMLDATVAEHHFFHQYASSVSVARTDIKLAGDTNGLPALSLYLGDTRFCGAVPPPAPATPAHQPPLLHTSLWWQLLRTPCPVDVSASNIALHITAPWLSSPLNARLSLMASADGPALSNHLQMSCSMLQPLKAEWTASAAQHSNLFDLLVDVRSIALPRLLKELDPYLNLPAIVSKGIAEGNFHATLCPSSTGFAVTSLYAAVGLSGVDGRLPAGSVRFNGMHLVAILKTTASWLPALPVADRWNYLLSVFKGTGLVRADSCDFADVSTRNLHGKLQLASNTVALLSSGVELFDGSVNATGLLSRRNVKNADYMRFKYELMLQLTNISAGSFCDAFNLYDNRLEGRFSGELTTAVFHTWVKMLRGSLRSQGGGTFYFPESETYVAGMKSGMDKQLVTIMTERLKDYSYQDARVSFTFDQVSKVTAVTFSFKSDYDSYQFPIFLHMSWIDALKLIQSLQQ